MDEIFEMIENFLKSECEDATDFSIDLEDYICDNYDQIATVNEKVAEMLNENLPDICASYEHGMDIQLFKDEIKQEYEKILKII